MQNGLLEPLPEITMLGVECIDAADSKQVWEMQGKRPEYLGKFVKLYPAVLLLSWVRQEMGKWYAQRLMRIPLEPAHRFQGMTPT